MLRRFLCLFSACAVLFFCSVSAFATGTEIGPYTGGEIGPVSGGGVGVPVSMQAKVDVVEFWEATGQGLRTWANRFGHLLDEDVCPNAPQLGGGHNFIPRRTLKDGQVGLYYVCEYCGKAYGEALEEAYQEYVETLPGTQYNSGGGYLWYPGAVDFVDPVVFKFTARGDFLGTIQYAAHAVSGTQFVGLARPVNAGGTGVQSQVSLTLTPGMPLTSTTSCDAFQFECDWGRVTLPVTGYYTAVVDAFTVFDDRFSARDVQSALMSAGTVLRLGYGHYGVVSSGTDCRDPLWPAFWILPFEGEVYSEGGVSVYAGDTRVSSDSNSGLYGYVHDGTLYQSSVTSIYNETSNVYTNPVTGTTSDVSSWTYDYSDRSYHLTTNEGDAVTVTYGDEAITINEGDTVYNVLYLMEEPDNVQADPSHTHSYTSSVTQAPTCTAPGVRTLTCSGCGDVSTETIPATGHSYQSAVTMEPTCVNTGVRTFTCATCGDVYTVSISATGHVWQTVRSVPTTYDSETGQLVQEGYILYECATCGEQYKITSDSGGSSLPSPSGGGTSTGGGTVSTGGEISTDVDSSVGKGFLATIAHGLTEDLPEVLEAFSEMFTTFPAFYGGYTVFLKDGIAGCLPDVPKMTMGFGVATVTAIGIIRKIIGR